MYKLQTQNWYLERIIFLLAGVFALGGVIMGHFVHHCFFYLAGFVGLMQIIFALTGFCPMAIFLSRLGVKSKLGKEV